MIASARTATFPESQASALPKGTWRKHGMNVYIMQAHHNHKLCAGWALRFLSKVEYVVLVQPGMIFRSVLLVLTVI